MTDLVLNPRAELVVDRDLDGIHAVTVRAPTRERGLVLSRVTTSDPPEVLDVLAALSEGRAVDMELEDDAFSALENIGLLIPRGQEPKKILLRNALHDVPLRRSFDHKRLRVNPSLRFQDALGPCEEGWVAAESVGRKRGSVRGSARTNGFAEDCAWAWVSHEGIPVPTPISIEDGERPMMRRLSPGEAPPADLDDQDAARLVSAGILVDPEEEAKRGAAWNDERKNGRRAFEKTRCAALRGLLHPAFVAALRRYYRALVAEGYSGFDTTLGRNRHWMHNEPVSRVIHASLAALTSELAGEPLKGSYVYFGKYRDQAELVRHRDRDQCPVSISLLVDYEPDPEGPSPWPLRVETNDAGPEGYISIRQSLGDGALFDGTKLHHHRPALPEGHTSTSLFLHYVPVGFDGALD